ncbi:hypothetical protein J3E72DRAFT_434855 [Bipolaris maydis]|nr:hypothetical protein J3E72DRAFT_434855 [Bipolaris maydis]
MESGAVRNGGAASCKDEAAIASDHTQLLPNVLTIKLMQPQIYVFQCSEDHRDWPMLYNIYLTDIYMMLASTSVKHRASDGATALYFEISLVYFEATTTTFISIRDWITQVLPRFPMCQNSGRAGADVDDPPVECVPLESILYYLLSDADVECKRFDMFKNEPSEAQEVAYCFAFPRTVVRPLMNGWYTMSNTILCDIDKSYKDHLYQLDYTTCYQNDFSTLSTD